MIRPDPSQAAVLAFDPTRHARILGAPGTGKSAVLIEMTARALDLPGWSEHDVLAVAPGRRPASELRAAIEHRVQRAIGGVPARTPASLAFTVLAEAAARTDATAPRLMTGTLHDEIIASVVEELVEGSPAAAPPELGGIAGEVLRTAAFRAELREFSRVLDDFALDAAQVRADLGRLAGTATADAFSSAPPEALVGLWLSALDVIERTEERRADQHPDELSASALLRAAARALRAGEVRPPRLLLVDDAQELGEGQLGLLAACAAAGSRVWVFGDPDIATSAFHGERTGALANLAAELERRGAPASSGSPGPHDAHEQFGVLGTVHRHGGALRGLVASLTSRVGAAAAGEQRAAVAADADASASAGADERDGAIVRFVRAPSPAEQLGTVAHRLRSRRLGLDGPVTQWGEMAVICRSRSEASRIARGLALHQVPTGVAAGGIVLREHRVVRDLIALLRDAIGLHPIAADDVLELLAGPIGGLDPVAVRRLRGALMMQERREARDEERDARDVDELVLDAFRFPGAEPAVDSSGGRALRRIGTIAAAGAAVHRAGGTPREALWALWDGTKLAGPWQDEALAGRGARSDEANRSLDAVLGLFFALQRHEEQDSERPIGEILGELLESAVPEDSLARSAARDAVVVTTPQGAVGSEFSFVAIVGPQDGTWPNLRSRGSLLGTVAFERWLRGGEATTASRGDTVHDELRLFAQAVSRARDELLVAAIADDEHHPSPFFAFGGDHLVHGLPSSRLTLRGATAQMRRRLTSLDDGEEFDAEALASLAELAREAVPGAHPDEWYGVLPPSTDAPLYAGDARIPVSPSRLEAAEQCPLNWAVSVLGGGTGSVQASIGTLVHHALETAQGHDPEELLAAIMSEWRKLPFDAEWEAERARRTAAAMADGLAAYLREFDASDRELIGRETGFAIEIGRAELRGMADRLEQRRTASGVEVTVLDLKTGRTPPSKADAEQHVQMQAYQLGVSRGAFDLADPPDEGAASGGARLLYVHPDATKQAEFVERVQQPLSVAAGAELEARVEQIAEVMAAGAFTARVEHHCSDPHQPGDCRLHIIRAVSRA
ncbi:PD-(D/E)XK nuclease family protein [Leucobacter sp. gxy201]|uniref:PD-(D/E)XK nuclease family protein n=1 Tax=Leucobacter sp. gxy201 TaxID=2957200 RepID=UPI003DA1C5C4